MKTFIALILLVAFTWCQTSPQLGCLSITNCDECTNSPLNCGWCQGGTTGGAETCLPVQSTPFTLGGMTVAVTGSQICTGIPVLLPVGLGGVFNTDSGTCLAETCSTLSDDCESCTGNPACSWCDFTQGFGRCFLSQTGTPGITVQDVCEDTLGGSIETMCPAVTSPCLGPDTCESCLAAGDCGWCNTAAGSASPASCFPDNDPIFETVCALSGTFQNAGCNPETTQGTDSTGTGTGTEGGNNNNGVDFLAPSLILWVALTLFNL